MRRQLRQQLDYIASPSTVIPLLLLLILIIYYLVSLTGALREANQDLRIQLRRERTEGRKKMLKLPKTDDAQNDGNPMDRWRKVLEASSPLTPTSGAGGQPTEQEELVKTAARKELLSRIMKKALRKSSNTSDDDSQPPFIGGGTGGGSADVRGATTGHHHHHHHPHNNDDDGTDTEQQESLPHDKEVKVRSIPKLLRLKAAAAHRNSVDEKNPTDQPAAAPRKISMAQMFKMAAKKENKTKETVTAQPPPPIKDESHPASLYKVEKIVESVPTPSPDAEQNCIPSVAGGRRRSILLRQNNLIEAPLLAPLATADEASTVNYKVVNEKNQEMEKRTKRRTSKGNQPETQVVHQKEPEPTVFQFDKNDIGDVSDDDNTSYREIEFKNISSSSSQRDAMREYSSDTSWTEDTCRESVSPGAAMHQSPVPAERPKRRFSSFMGLVRMVVLMRRQEQKLNSKRSQKDGGGVAADSIREDGEYKSASAASSSGTMRREPSVTKKKAKRQDSQTSIWSDNIPVITISKTESDECILEGGGGQPNHRSKQSEPVPIATAANVAASATNKKRHHRKRNDRGGGGASD